MFGENEIFLLVDFVKDFCKEVFFEDLNIDVIREDETYIEANKYDVGILVGEEVWGYAVQNFPGSNFEPPDSDIVETKRLKTWQEAANHLICLILQRKLEWYVDSLYVKDQLKY